MAPYATDGPTGVLFEDDTLEDTPVVQPPKERRDYKLQIVWKNVIIFTYAHVASIYGIYLALTSAKLMTTIYAYVLSTLSLLGITAGAHRLWTHRSYKAKWQLRLLLMILNTIAFQDAVVDWARDHRVHHKYTETDADPHNAKRGFFFSHIGWLLCRKHPDVAEKGKGIDLSDLKADPILAFQKKYYPIMMPLMTFIIPMVIPVVCWNETWTNSYFIASILRYTFSLNVTWLVNSAAHIYGNKPYDKNIDPTDHSVVAVLALGEGWHNYHHVFPWDYRTSEYGKYWTNLTTNVIDFFAWIGWAYDLKSVSTEMVKKRVVRTGDGSHHLWGWGDKDQNEEDIDGAIIINSQKKGE